MKQGLRNKLLLLVLLLTAVSVFSQENISSSRPGQCIGSRTIDKGILQFQTGLQSDFGVYKNFQSPNAIVRYGLLNHMEFRVVDVLTITTGDVNVGAPEFSVLIDLVEGKKWVPQMALCVFSNLGLANNNLYNGVTLSGSNSLNDRWGYSFIYTLSYSSQVSGKYAFAINYKVANFTPFLELYGDVEKNGMKFDTGVAYLLNEDIQLDLYGGSDFQFEQYFISAGVSFRFFK